MHRAKTKDAVYLNNLYLHQQGLHSRDSDTCGGRYRHDERNHCPLTAQINLRHRPSPIEKIEKYKFCLEEMKYSNIDICNKVKAFLL